ncbi:MAG: hypothetical protein EU536_04910 [Promethearchaeota archaeon]|nr:MAG: hypothetical protein EU536_04910 [Candidatus Lokiarchaeota archaeon]
MTHSLHRTGTPDGLTSDYVLLAMRAAGIHDRDPEAKETAKAKLISIGEIFSKHNPTNIMMERLRRFSPVVTASYTDIETVGNILFELKQKNFGLSIVVSGLLSEIQKCAKTVGLEPHTVHLSLGIFGKKELLPPEKFLEITTQCGHHCISPQSVEHALKEIKQGKISIETVSEKLAKPCICGIVNPIRVRQILQELIAEGF